MDKEEIERQKIARREISEVLAKRFILSFEQAENLYLAYFLCGSADEGIEATSKSCEISKEVIKRVFYSLDELGQMIKEEQDLRKWWETGEG